MILAHNNQQLARQYFEQLPTGDISRRLYDGEKYSSPTTFLGKLGNAFSLSDKLSTLNKFYPYQKVVQQTIKEIQSDNQNYVRNSLLFTAVSWTLIFNFARRGYVAPLFQQYGSFFQTHRIYRQYLYSLVGPLLYTGVALKCKYYTHIEHLWIVHANRLNQQKLEDPLYTYYPKSSANAKRNVLVNTTFQEYGREGYVEQEDDEE